MLHFHIGLPRTGTTILQKYLLPSLSDCLFIGKDFQNIRTNTQNSVFSGTEGEFQGLLKNDHVSLRRHFSMLMRSLVHSNQTHDVPNRQKLFKGIKRRLAITEEFAEQNGFRDVIWSDEYISESLAGKFLMMKNGDDLPLLQFIRNGIIKPIDHIIITLREPVTWIVSSYHRTTRKFIVDLDALIPIDKYIHVQLKIMQRKHYASRLFWCFQKQAITFIKELHDNTRFVHFEKLINSMTPITYLVGKPFSESRLPYSEFDNENSSEHFHDINRRLLSLHKMDPDIPDHLVNKQLSFYLEEKFPNLVEKMRQQQTLDDL